MKEAAATARRSQDGGTDRLQAPRGGEVDIGNGIRGVPFGQNPSTDDTVNSIPAGIDRGAGGGGDSRGPVTIHNTMTVNGSGENPQELANKVQRQITRDWSHRAHDLEPELT